jgi:hypothetical protein
MLRLRSNAHFSDIGSPFKGRLNLLGNLVRVAYPFVGTGRFSLEAVLLRQIRVLQICVVFLLLASALFSVNYIHPFLPERNFKVINAERINIRERDGTLKAVLSDSAGFNEGQRSEQAGGVRFSGLMFYNEEGQETGGLVYQGKAIPGGQDSDVSLTMDQYRQDQNVYLNHTEHKDDEGLSISDGLIINSRPDWTSIKTEQATYGDSEKAPADQREAMQLKALQNGKISTRRLFFGVRRGVKDHSSYDDAGVFIKNKWGRDAIKLYVDSDNKPHFEIYDQFGKKVVYELKVAKSK